MPTKPAPKSSAAGYEFPGYPDDPTLGGAITAEMRDRLDASVSGDTPPPPPDPEPEQT